MTPARETAAPPVSPMRDWGTACAIFIAVVLLSLGGTLLVAWQLGGGRLIQGGLAAWGLCWGAAFVALMMVLGGRLLNQSLPAILLAMLVRMGIPLAIAIYLNKQSPFWAEARLFQFLLGNYFIALLAETGLAIRLLGSLTPLGKPASPSASDATSQKFAGGKLAS